MIPPFVGCVEKEVKRFHILSVNVARWLRKSIKDATTMLGNIYIATFVRNIILIKRLDGMNTHRKEQLKVII